MVKQKLFILILSLSILFASNIDDIKKSMIINYIEQTRNIKMIQKHNEALIEQNSIYYRNIVRAARKYCQSFIAKKWGKNNVKLSTKKNFTQYSEDLKSRESIDFKKGEITLEVLTKIGQNVDKKIFRKKLDNLKRENLQQAVSKDPLFLLSSKYLNKKHITYFLNKKNKKYQFLKSLIPEDKIKKNEIKEKIITVKGSKKSKIVSVTIKMVPNHLKILAEHYKNDVLENAKKFNIMVSYIFGTIQTESYFNPLAISNVPAYGLMQIIPATAGKDAYFALTGKKRLLPPYYLYEPKNNITIGTKYIQIIQDKYLKGVKNKKSLFYCTAIAYNAGVGTLFKIFTGSRRKRKKAITIINSMSPDEIYRYFRTTRKLSIESKNYIKKIKINSQNYHQWDIRLRDDKI